jgi:large subunit ribosomal protein L10
VRPEKAFAAREIAELMEQSGSLILTSYSGLDSERMTRLRRAIRDKSARYFVVKNRLLARAARERGLEDLCSLLTGQVGVVFGGDDWIAILKTVADFSKQNEELKVLGGVCEKKVRTAKEMAMLAVLPPKEVVAAQFLGMLVSPLSEFVQVLSEPVRSLALVLGSAQEPQDTTKSQQDN